MFIRGGDPLEDFNQYDAEQQREFDKLPKCDYCGNTITDDYYYDIGGDVICEECLNDHFKKCVEDYIE